MTTKSRKGAARKLTEQQRQEVREAYCAQLFDMPQLAHLFDVSKSTIFRTVHPDKEALEREKAKESPDKGRDATRRYRARHPERAKESGRKSWLKWWTEKREQALARLRESNARQRANHPERHKHDKHRRRGAPGDLTKKQLAIIMSLPCAYCGGPSEHLEHCTPISRGGWNSAENCVGACAKCNLSKRDQTVLEFLGLWVKK